MESPAGIAWGSGQQSLDGKAAAQRGHLVTGEPLEQSPPDLAALCWPWGQ